jgi:hypothetical protein
MEEYEQGTRVEFEVQEIKGTGTINGVTNTGVAILGRCYIIELDVPIETYEYTHIGVWEVDLQRI